MTGKHEPVMQGADPLRVAIVPLDCSGLVYVPEPIQTLDACVCMHCFVIYLPEDQMGHLGRLAAGKEPRDATLMHDFRVQEVALVDKPLPSYGFLKTIDPKDEPTTKIELNDDDGSED